MLWPVSTKISNIPIWLISSKFLFSMVLTNLPNNIGNKSAVAPVSNKKNKPKYNFHLCSPM
jgi:hypothetical protein